MDNLSTIQRFPLYRMLSTMKASPSQGMNMSTIRFSPMWMRMMPREAEALSTAGLISHSEYTSVANRFIPPIVLEVETGFGNRLNAMVSGMCAASDLNKDVRVIWKSAAKFSELFDVKALPSRVYVHDTLPVGYVQHTSDTQAQWDALKGMSTLIYLKSGGRFHTTEDAKFVSFLKGLKPLPLITDAVTATLLPYVGTTLVGVDLLRSESAQTSLMAAMTAYPSSTKFFVASECQEDRQALETQFPGRIVGITKNENRTPVQVMQDTLKDFVALSRCSEVLGSKGSSFSELAAVYGGAKFTAVSA
jgi:hypothetical protein